MSELALQKDEVLAYLCDGVNGLGYKKESHGMVSPRLFLTADLQMFLRETSTASWRKVRKHYGSDEELMAAIEEKLYSDLLRSQNVATFIKQRLSSSFTFEGEPFFLFLASGGTIGEQSRDFDKNIFTVVPEMSYTFAHEGKSVYTFRPDLAFFVNGIYFGYCELKSTIDGQTAREDGRRKIACDYVTVTQRYAQLAYTNDVTETLRRRMLHVFEKAIHITTCDLQEHYVVRNLSSKTKELKDRFVKNKIYPSDAIDEVVEEIKAYPKSSPEEHDPVKIFRQTFARFYDRREVEKEIRYYNFIEYEYKGHGKNLTRLSNSGTLISPRPKQKYGVDKVMTKLEEFLDHESEPDYYLNQLRRQLEAQHLNEARIDELISERDKMLNNKYVYSLLLQYAAGFGKSNIIGWLASMMSDMRRAGRLVFDKILLVVDRIQLRNQLNEMMTNMNVSNVNFTEVSDRKELTRTMRDKNVRIAVINIQKFANFEEVVAEQGLGTKQMRVAFIIDEIHRSNTGSLHDEMRSSFESLQDALEKPFVDHPATKVRQKNVIIGLTATPSEAVLARFGEFCKLDHLRPIWVPFDSYTMREAIEDGFVLNPVSHIFPWATSMEYSVKAGTANDEVNYANSLSLFYNNKPRILANSRMIVERLYTTVYPSIRGYGKAMLATSSIEAAQSYVTSIRQIIKERGEMPRFNDARVYIVYSDRQGVPSASNFNDGHSEASVIQEFQKSKNGLMIVVDKLQTGFDEKYLHTLFLDKEISGINAIQTISRINRTVRHKVDCHIIDLSYRNVNIQNIADAMAKYCDMTFTVLEPLATLDRLDKLCGELKEEEPYALFYGDFEAIGHLAPEERTTARNSLLLGMQAWISREIAKAKQSAERTPEGPSANNAKRIKKKASEYLRTLVELGGIVEIADKLKDPTFLAFWESYRRIYNTLTARQPGRNAIDADLDVAGYLPATSVEMVATVLPEEEEVTLSIPGLIEHEKPALSSERRRDPVVEFVRKLNEEEEGERELIEEVRRFESDFLKYVSEDDEFQKTIHTEGGFITEEDKKRAFHKVIRSFQRNFGGAYPTNLHSYLNEYIDRLYDYATRPHFSLVPQKEYEHEALEINKVAEHTDNNLIEVVEKKNKETVVVEEGSPFRRTKLSSEELLKEFHAHFRCNDWDGNPFEHHNPEELRETRLLLDSPNYYEVIPTGKPCSKDNSLYLTITQEWFDKIVSGEKTVEYRQIKESMLNRFLDMRVSMEGAVLTNMHLPDNAELRFDAYCDGIFGYVPRYYEYLRLAVGYRKNRDTATIRIKGLGFVPDRYHKGGVFRLDYMDESITEEMYKAAAKKGLEAIQDLYYKADGPDTQWIFAIHLGEIVEVRRK